MNLKTLHMTNAWHEKSGGVGTFYRALIEAANRHGRFVRLIVPGAKTGVEEAGRFGRIYTVKAPRAPFDPNYRLLMPHRFLFPRTEVHRILNEERPDLVEICDKYSLPYLGGLLRRGWLRKLPFRPVVAGLSCERLDHNLAAYFSSGPIARTFSRFYMKWLYFPMFDHHIAVSEHVAGELLPASRGHAVQRAVYVSPMGVDCERFTPRRRSPEGRRRMMERVGTPGGAALLLYAGRLAREKNLPLLIDMMERLAARRDRDYRLVVAGTGGLRASLERECGRRIPGRTCFLGNVGDREALASLYSNCDVFVHPNPREPFGIAPLEAMAAGLALVGPRSGGLTSYANQDNSWLADATGEGFAGAVRAALDQSELGNRKLEAARRTAEANSWAEVTSRYLRLYEEIHARWHGRRLDWSQQPSFYSTPGDWLGAEVGGSN